MILSNQINKPPRRNIHRHLTSFQLRCLTSQTVFPLSVDRQNSIFVAAVIIPFIKIIVYWDYLASSDRVLQIDMQLRLIMDIENIGKEASQNVLAIVIDTLHSAPMTS